MEIKSELDKRISEIEKILEKYLPREEGYQKTIFEAMNYSVRAGGKRLRLTGFLEEIQKRLNLLWLPLK